MSPQTLSSLKLNLFLSWVNSWFSLFPWEWFGPWCLGSWPGNSLCWRPVRYSVCYWVVLGCVLWGSFVWSGWKAVAGEVSAGSCSWTWPLEENLRIRLRILVDLGLKPLRSASKRWGLPANRRKEIVPVLFPLNKQILFLVFLYSICGSVNIRLFPKLLKSMLL